MPQGRINYLKIGDWNATCDVCGFVYKASQLKSRWDGMMVCTQDWEPRQPLDFVRPVKDVIAPPWIRTEPVQVGTTTITAGTTNFTNRVLQSETLAVSPWTMLSSTLAASFIQAPDGKNTAQKLQETAGTSQHSTRQSITITSGATQTLSVYAKASDRSWAYLTVDDGTNTNSGRAWFDLTNGVSGSLVSTGAGFTASGNVITNIGNGWYRLSFVCTTVGTAIRIQASISTGDAIASYAGSVGMGAYFWGFQLESNPPSRYIPTTTTVTTVGEYQLLSSDILSIVTASTIPLRLLLPVVASGVPYGISYNITRTDSTSLPVYLFPTGSNTIIANPLYALINPSHTTNCTNDAVSTWTVR